MTRRSALLAFSAAPLALAAAPAASGQTTTEDDATVITEVLRTEHLGRATYGAVAARMARAGPRALATSFGGHEQAHLSTLAALREALGAAPVQVPDPERAAAGLAELLDRPAPGALRSDEARLELLLAVEEHLIATYVDALARLQAANLVRSAAVVLGCQGQHAAVLRDALGREPLPRAVDTGSPRTAGQPVP